MSIEKVARKHRLSEEQELIAATAIDYIITKIGIEGLEALVEVHQSNPIKANLINGEIKNHIKAKAKGSAKRTKFFS